MADEIHYDGVVSLFLGGRWRDASCAMSVHDGSIFISVYPASLQRDMAVPLTMQMSVDLFIKIADRLREKEIEGCEEEIDIDDELFGRMESVEDQILELRKQITDLAARVNTGGGERRHQYYGTEYPNFDSKYQASWPEIAEKPYRWRVCTR